MNIPREPQADTPIPADWGRDVVRCLRSLRSKPGPGITLNRTPEGTTISSKGSGPVQAAEGGPVACKVTGGNSLDGYYVDLYPNGPHNSASGSGQLRLLEIAGVSTLPVGAWVLGWPVIITVTGGSE